MPRIEIKTLDDRRKIRYWLDGKVLQKEATHFDNVRPSSDRETYELWRVDGEPLILHLDQSVETEILISERIADTLRKEGVVFDKDQVIQDRIQVAPPGEMV